MVPKSEVNLAGAALILQPSIGKQIAERREALQELETFRPRPGPSIDSDSAGES